MAATPFPTVKQAADWIRSAFFRMMGDLNGWPYGADNRSAAYYDLEFISGDPDVPAPPSPIRYSVLVKPATTADTGSARATGSTDNSNLAQVSAIGSFSASMNYLTVLTYTLPKSATPHEASFGPQSGADLSNQGNPVPIVVTVEDFPSIILGVLQLNYADGSPAAGVFVLVIVSVSGDPADLSAWETSGYSNGAGQFLLNFGADISAKKKYTLGVTVQPAQNDTRLLAMTSFAEAGARLTDGSLKETVSLPAKGFGFNAGRFALGVIAKSRLAAGATYEYTVKNQDGTEVGAGSGVCDSKGDATLPAPTPVGEKDVLTIHAKATFRESDDKAPLTAEKTVTVTGDSFLHWGAFVLLDVGGPAPPAHHGRT